MTEVDVPQTRPPEPLSIHIVKASNLVILILNFLSILIDSLLQPESYFYCTTVSLNIYAPSFKHAETKKKLFFTAVK